MDALGVVIASTGAFLVYAAVKGDHPWNMFLEVIRGLPITSGSTVASSGQAVAIAPGTSAAVLGVPAATMGR